MTLLIRSVNALYKTAYTNVNFGGWLDERTMDQVDYEWNDYFLITLGYTQIKSPWDNKKKIWYRQATSDYYCMGSTGPKTIYAGSILNKSVETQEAFHNNYFDACLNAL